MRKQTYDGSWLSPGQRPPLEYYSFTATALTVKNIQSYMPAILHEEVKQRIAKARAWLINTKPEANEEKVFQLLGLTWSNADKKSLHNRQKNYWQHSMKTADGRSLIHCKQMRTQQDKVCMH